MKKALPWILGGLAFYLLFFRKGALSSLFGGGAIAPTTTPGGNTTVIPGQAAGSTMLESFLGGSSGGISAGTAAGLGTAAGSILSGLGSVLSGAWTSVKGAASDVADALGLSGSKNVNPGTIDPNVAALSPGFSFTDPNFTPAPIPEMDNPDFSNLVPAVIPANDTSTANIGNDAQNVGIPPSTSDFTYAGQTIDGFTDLGTFSGGGTPGGFDGGAGNFVPTGSVAVAPPDNFTTPLIGEGGSGGDTIEGVDFGGGGGAVNFDNNGVPSDYGGFQDTELA